MWIRGESSPLRAKLVRAFVVLFNHEKGVMSKFISTTRDIVCKLQTEYDTLVNLVSSEQIANDAYLEKLCRDHEESENVFHEKFQTLEVRLNKSKKVLDDLVEKRFRLRESKLKEIEDIEKLICIARINTQKINEDTDIILRRIERAIETQLTNLLIMCTI